MVFNLPKISNFRSFKLCNDQNFEKKKVSTFQPLAGQLLTTGLPRNSGPRCLGTELDMQVGPASHPTVQCPMWPCTMCMLFYYKIVGYLNLHYRCTELYACCNSYWNSYKDLVPKSRTNSGQQTSVPASLKKEEEKVISEVLKKKGDI
jgi:hypothetical protein